MSNDNAARFMFLVKGLAGVYFFGKGMWHLAMTPFQWAFVAFVALGIAFLALMWIDPLRDEMVFGKKPETTDDSQNPADEHANEDPAASEENFDEVDEEAEETKPVMGMENLKD